MRHELHPPSVYSCERTLPCHKLEIRHFPFFRVLVGLVSGMIFARLTRGKIHERLTVLTQESSLSPAPGVAGASAVWRSYDTRACGCARVCVSGGLVA